MGVCAAAHTPLVLDSHVGEQGFSVTQPPGPVDRPWRMPATPKLLDIVRAGPW